MKPRSYPRRVAPTPAQIAHQLRMGKPWTPADGCGLCGDTKVLRDGEACPWCAGKGFIVTPNDGIDACPSCAASAEIEYQEERRG